MDGLRRMVAIFILTSAALLVAAPAAFGADGAGLAGRPTDKVVTYFGFGIMGFFTLLVIVLSLIQGRLDSRKERMREELERLRR